MTIQVNLRQPSFPDFCAVTAAVEMLATKSLPQERGAVYTRREVVDFLLDLVGYRRDQPLHRMRLLEPSFGAGDFLLPAVDRLLEAWAASDDEGEPFDVLGPCVRAVELHRETFEATRGTLVLRLVSAGIAQPIASSLADCWLVNGDSLLVDLPGSFDVVIGNPPYLRQELIPAVLLAEYRKRYDTLFDRADLYVPFIERALRLLLPGGALGFICADRWMKNRYGGPLRQLVAEGFHLKIHVDMSDTPAFHSDVTAYPAITVIVREQPGLTRIAVRPEIDGKALGKLAVQLLALGNLESGSGVRELCGVTSGAEPWVLTGADHLSIVRRLEAQLPNLEAAGCRVGIGVATGADRAFIGSFEELDVEPDRKLPLAMTRDISSGCVQWRGFGVVNPFADGGGLVDLSQYPRLAKYLEARRDQIANRHCARKSPAFWYRTIDRISPELAKLPKLLIPDIKGESHVVYEEGTLYPHHNLYHVTSNEWDLRALQAVLLSGVARLFVATYSTKMRGGFLRFQAQYLRRIRIPKWEHVDAAMRRALISAATAQDLAACNRAAFELYGLSDAEKAAVGGCHGREAQR